MIKNIKANNTTVILFYFLLAGIFLEGCQHNALFQNNGSDVSAGAIPPGTETHSLCQDIHEVAKKAKEAMVHVKTYTSCMNIRHNCINEGVGIIYSEDGYIVTNYHLIREETDQEIKRIKINVILHNKISYKAKIVNADLKTGLVVLRIEADKLPILGLDGSNTFEVNKEFLGINDRLSNFNVVKIKEQDFNPKLRPFIQTTKLSEQSNNGGALVNLNGSLVGLYAPIYANTVANTRGGSFVIPISLVKKVVDDLIKDADQQSKLLGITSLPIEFDSSSGFAFRIHDVSKTSPYAHLLQPEDVITQIKDDAFNKDARLCDKIIPFIPGNRIALTLYRKKEIKKINIVLNNLKQRPYWNKWRFF